MSAKKKASSDTTPRLVFANDGSFMDVWAKMQAAQGGKQAQPGDAPAKTRNDTDAKAFIPASTFSGPKPGYVFKKSTEGLGYYADVLRGEEVAKPSRQGASTTGPVILKRKPIVAIQKRGESEQDSAAAKKKKTENGDFGKQSSSRQELDEDSRPHYLKEMDRYRSTKCGSDTVHERPLVK